MRLRSAPALSVMLMAGSLTAALVAADPTDENLKAAEKRKAADISAASDAITDLEAALKEANKKRQLSEMKSLALELKKARMHLQDVKDRSIESFAKEIAAKRASEDESRRVAKEKAAEQLEREKKEAERLRLSGGCPLEITGLNFFHARGRLSGTFDRPGPSTVAVIWVANRSKEPVDAYEVLVQFFDGFDKLIAEHTLQGPLLKSGEESKTLNGLPEATTAITMKVLVKKAKLPDGSIWERLPEHKATGLLIKKPEGAEVLGQ